MQQGIDIVIINYYSTAKIQALLQTVNESKTAALPLHIIIVSNSAEKELDVFKNQGHISIIMNQQNRGFGHACNQALQLCKYSYLLLLNPDTLLKPDTLQAAFNFMQANTANTVLGVKHLNEHNRVAASCSRFPKPVYYLNDIFGLSKIKPAWFHGASLMRDWDHASSQYVDQVMGAFMFIRRDFISLHGFMDPRYFVFGEDLDFCKKVWLSGGKVFYNADIAIIHEGANSTEGISHIKLCYATEGKLKYANKYFSSTWYYIILFAVLVIEPFTRICFSLAAAKFKQVAETIAGYKMLYSRKQFK